jgi:Tfp pilus assembly PilM family ATPase
MAFGLSKTRLSPIAIDFGADSLKLLQIVPGNPPQIVAAASMVVPDHARNDPYARSAFFQEALKLALKQAPFKGKRATCSIPAYQALVQHFQISKAENEDLDSQIGLHLRQRLNVNPSRMVIRSFQVGQIVRGGVAKHEVICMAASREAVMRHIEMAHRAKLDVVGMHCEPHTAIKAFSHLYRRADDVNRTTCFIDIGAATTKVTIAHGTELVFAQTIHSAGDHLTKRLAGEKSIEFAEARRQRMAQDSTQETAENEANSEQATLPQGADERRGTGVGGLTGLAVIESQFAAATALTGDTGNTCADAADTFEEMRQQPRTQTATLAPGEQVTDDDPLECLIEELQMGVRYHRSMYPDRPIEKLVFIGGESNHASTCQQIAKTLRIGAQLGDPLARMNGGSDSSKTVNVDMTEPQPGWAVPYGLCLCETNNV